MESGISRRKITTAGIGAHMSAAGGLPNALLRGAAAGCDVIQLFTTNQRRWKRSEPSEAETRTWFETIEKTGVRPLASHASYLVNPASPRPETRRRSVVALAHELETCGRLGIPCVVLHPGSHGGSGTERGLTACAESIEEAVGLSGLEQDELPLILLETTSGGGHLLGGTFEEVGRLLSMLDERGVPSGVCFDTCHVFAAGYELRSEKGWSATWRAFRRSIPMERLKLFHVNDSKEECGSRVDRHAHIGKGKIGLEAFERLMEEYGARIPFILETPKKRTAPPPSEADEWDVENLETLRRLAKKAGHGVDTSPKPSNN